MRHVIMCLSLYHVFFMYLPIHFLNLFVLYSHAIESYTAIPYQKRGPRPLNPNMRPAYQGSNPVSDVWSKHALGIVAKYLKR